MSFSVDDLHELARLLRERPEWRAEIRRLVLADELLALPGHINALEEAHRRTQEELKALAEAQRATQEELRALAEIQRQMAGTLNALVEAQRRTEEAM